MKKVVFLLFLSVSIFADVKFEISIYEKIFPAIFGKNIIKVYTDKKDKNLFKDSRFFLVVKNYGDSDFVFGDIQDNDSLCMDIPKFVKTYKSYKTKDDVFGALYWRKGRPQLKFKKSVMKKFNLSIPDIIKEYVQ